MLDFNSFLSAVASGAAVNSEDILYFISQPSKKDRFIANFKLAEAYYSVNECEQAKVFIQRAWEFSGFMEQCLPLYINIHSALNDIDSIREAHKRIGMKKAYENKVGEALACFNSWQYAYALHKGVDAYKYDYDILDSIAALARPYAYLPRPFQPFENRKVRLAYLMYGTTQTNSVIVKNGLSFAQFHDKSLFEVKFFVPEQESIVSRYEEAKGHIETIKQFKCDVIVAPSLASEESSLIQLAASIHDYNPDILITCAGLADLKHYFISALQPAPLIIGLCQGPPPQFVAPSFDWSISWTKHPLIDCPTDCTLVAGGITLPTRKHSTMEAKTFMGIPEKSLVLMSCGRPAKFQDQSFWKVILDVVRLHPNVYYVAVGINQPLTFLESLVTAEIRERVKIIGWEKDFLKVLSMADVVVDTYPSGGGVSILDAMALGIPVVSFKNNYMQHFTQTDWSPAEEFMGIPELLVERGNMEQLKLLLSRLLTNEDYRNKLSELSMESIHLTSGSPEDMVRSCENVYLSVLSKKSDSNFSDIDYKSLLPPLPSPPSLLGRILDKFGRVKMYLGRFVGVEHKNN
jgi:glycosyltransferase involved in cell wall biosynthesis